MMKLETQCITCSSDDNLDTKMDVIIDETSYRVAICTSCEDDASPKVIKTSIRDKISQLDELRAQAKTFGMKLVSIDQPQQLQVQPKASDVPGSIQRTQKVHALPVAPVPKTVGLPGAQVEHAIPSTIQGSNGQLIAQPKVFHREVGVGVSEKGRQIPLATSQIDESGETQVTIVATSDQELQDRIKTIAEGAAAGTRETFGSGYSSHFSDCTMCNGTGFSAVDKNPCPRCKGKGMRVS